MSEIQYAFTINGEKWTRSQIERLEYERNLHILHQMKRHGVEIKDGGKILSDDDIDYLTAKKAWEVSIDTRIEYTGEKIIGLYKDSFAKSDEMWKKLAFSQDKPMKVSRCHMSVSGITIQEFMQMMRSMQVDDRVGLSAHPEHFVCNVEFDNGKLVGVEPFGMERLHWSRSWSTMFPSSESRFRRIRIPNTLYPWPDVLFWRTA